jgi:hypothetical protein
MKWKRGETKPVKLSTGPDTLEKARKCYDQDLRLQITSERYNLPEGHDAINAIKLICGH